LNLEQKERRRTAMQSSRWIVLTLILGLGACGGDQKSSDERAKEAQKAMQEGMQKEKQMYEGAQKAVEALEKKVEEKTK
jgi:hypothetical protein